MEHLIECRDIVKIHRARGLGGLSKGFRAVDGVSLSIDKNESFGLVGESGCGKTTFARALMYLDPPTSGSVRLGGVELGALKPAELRKFRRRIQIVFQDPNGALNPKMSIADSLAEGLVNRGIGKDERVRRIGELLDLVGISRAYRDRYPHEFSGGQKQRIVIARALSMEPDFIVLDEPVSNLDVSIQAQIVNLLSDLKRKLSLTYLFISHDLNLISYLCDTIGVMFKGRIVEQAPTDLLIGGPEHPYTRRLLSSVPGGALRGRLGADGGRDSRFGAADLSEPDEAESAARKAAAKAAPDGGCPYYPSCPLGDAECAASAPTLREITGGHVVSCHKVGVGTRPAR